MDLETFLLNTIARVNRRCQELDEECRHLKQLLKPWPRKKRDQPQEKLNGTQKEQVKEASEMSEEEKLALINVERLLQKAQITRQVKSKQSMTSKDDTDVSCGKETPENVTTGLRNDISKPEDTTRNHLHTSETKHKRTADKYTTSNTFSSQSQNPHTAGISKTVKPSATKQHKAVPDKRSRTQIQKPPTQTTKPSAQPNRISRPGTAGKTRHTPVHMSAPFKTDEHLKMPARRTMVHPQSHLRSKNNAARQTRPGSGISCNSYSALPAISIARDKVKGNVTQRDSHSNPGSCSNCADTNSRTVVDINTNSETLGELNTNSNNTDFCTEAIIQTHQASSEDSDESETDVDRAMSMLRASSTASVSDPGFVSMGDRSQLPGRNHQFAAEDCGGSGEKHSDEEPVFTLREHGSTLKIPKRLAKLVSQNESLRDQCRSARLVKKVSASDSGRDFIYSMEASWEISEELSTRVRALTCLKSHGMLLDTLNSLHLNNLSGNSSYRDLYHANRTMEFVLSVFASLQDETEYLTRVQYRELGPVPGPSASDTAELLDILPSMNKTDDVEPAARERLSGLREWGELRAQEVSLQAQHALLEAADAHWWPRCQEGERDPIFLKELYSLLSSCGQFSPAFVAEKV